MEMLPLNSDPEEVPRQENEGFSVEQETKTVFERINIPVIRQIFGEIRSRSGVAEKGNFIDTEDIQIDPQLPFLGLYDQGKLKINPYHEQFRQDVESPGDFRAKILRLLFHEETHVSAKNNDCTGPIKSRVVKAISDFKGEERPLDISGYQREMYKENIYNLSYFNKKEAGPHLSKRIDFHGFNEAVTEKIARHVFDEYLKRTGDKSLFTNSRGETASPWGYENDINFVDLFIETLSYASGIPKDKVWEAITAGYMSGLNLGSSELKDFFENTFGPLLNRQLQEGALSANEFAKNLATLSITEEQRNSILKILGGLSAKSESL